MQASGTRAGSTATSASITSNTSGTSSSNNASKIGSSQKGSKISTEDIQEVQNLIERCLQLYMNQTEVITALHRHSKIEPGFTSLVWQKLEQQNPEFFKAYNIRLRIKEQITAFNYLVSQQVQLVQKNPSAVPFNVTSAVTPTATNPNLANTTSTTRPIILQAVPNSSATYAAPSILPSDRDQLMTYMQSFDPSRSISTANSSSSMSLKASSNSSLSESTSGLISLELSTDQADLDTNQFFLSESDG